LWTYLLIRCGYNQPPTAVFPAATTERPARFRKGRATNSTRPTP